MSKLAKALTAAAGNAGAGALYVDDVFSTYLYDGNGTSQSIDNNIDLSGEGGMTWIKSRDIIGNNTIFDTARTNGFAESLYTNTTGAVVTGWAGSVDSTGFNLGVGYSNVNASGSKYASWSFRKAEKFFDVVTYTGDGDPNRTVAHNLGSVPACIIVKRLNSTGDWAVYHQGTSANPEQNYLWLNSTDSVRSSIGYWNDTAPTDTEFSVRTNFQVNSSGSTYVAYLFASDAGGFGDDGSENIIKCGSYSGNSSTNGPQINLGFEPQFLLVKAVNKAEYWVMADTMRGITGSTTDPWTAPNVAEADFDDKYFEVNATGFKPVTIDARLNGSGYNYIYIAIRRPMKTPESGTEVFAADLGGSVAPDPWFNSGFPVDMSFTVGPSNPSAFGGWFWSSRLTSGLRLDSSSTAAESSQGNAQYDYMTGAWDTNANTSYFTWMFKRATGFFDVVAYTGDGTTNQTENHNLGVVPEFIITKRRSSTYSWNCYVSALGEGKYTSLNSVSGSFTDTSIWNNTAPTSTQFTLGSFRSNFSGETYIAYLFATLDGISKVGSYTGTGSSQNIDCGFSSGARFILIKNVSDNADWLVYDSERGIVAGNDPYLAINSTAAEVTNTDYIDPLNAGFIANGSNLLVNKSGDTYIFLAIA